MKSEVVYYFAFDVANEIDLSRVSSILGQKPVPFSVPFQSGFPRDVPFPQPLRFELPPFPRLGGRPVYIQVHLYAVGVISICLRVRLEVATLADLMPLHHPRFDDGQSADAFARSLCTDICSGLAAAMTRASTITEPEAYTVFCLTDLGGERDTAAWLESQKRAVAGLLAEIDPDRISEAQVAEVIRQQRSQEKTDLVVIDWDAALAVDLDGPPEDVLYVLELANLQLEEFRTMDRALDRYLNRAYDDLEKRPITLFGVSSSALRKLRRFRVDVAKLADEVTHITKFVGDWYLARVYLGARERFHLDEWRASVESRLAQLDQLYTVVHGDLSEKRMFWLEVIVVVFFAIDLFILIVLHR